MTGAYTKSAFAGVVIILIFMLKSRRTCMKSSLAHEYKKFWEKILRIIKYDIFFMVVEALWNRVFEMALTTTIVSDFFMPRDHSRVGALRFAPVCPSVCPSVHHAFQYRVCVINSSHSFQWVF